jgi:RNA polymerase sigma-70 factor (sigma-E family)
VRASRRDEEFRSFYLVEAPRLKKLALLLTADPERAADLAQDALLKAYRSWSRIRNEDPGPYVRKILVNLVRNQHRRSLLEIRKRETPTLEMSSHDGQVENALTIASALAELSPVRRATILLRFYEDMPEADIARALDRPLNTVKSDIRRALEKLRPLLQEGVAR